MQVILIITGGDQQSFLFFKHWGNEFEGWSFLRKELEMKSTLHPLTRLFIFLAVLILPVSSVSAAGITGTKVGLVLDSPIDDGAWGQMAYEGLLHAQTDFGITPSVYLAIDPVTPAEAFDACAAAGNVLCIAVGYSLNNPVYNAASAHPSISYAIVDVDVPDDAPTNLRGVRFVEKEVGYLAGVLAAKMTTSHEVGVIGGIPVPAVVAFTTGYRNGAQCTDDAVNVMEEYSYDFGNPSHGAEIAEGMIDAGADVIFAAAGPTGNGAILYAGQHDKYAIGVDHDQYNTVFGGGTVDGSDKLLSSAMKRVDNAVYITVDDFLNSSDPWGDNQEYGLEEEGVGLAPYHETDSVIPESVKTYISDVSEKIADGQIHVDDPCAISIWYMYGSGSPDESALLENIAAIQAADPTLPRIITSSHTDQGQYGDAIQQGWGPDIFITTNDLLSAWIQNGIAHQMSFGAAKLDHTYAYAIDGVTGPDGMLYGVPESSKAVGLFYNKTVISSPPTTVDELKTMLTTGGKKFTANGRGAGSYFFYPFWHAFGGQLLESHGLCLADQGGFTEAMQYLVDLEDTGNAQLLYGYGVTNAEFVEGRADMIINGPWELRQFENAYGSNLGLSLIPNGTYGALPLTGIDGIFMNGQLPSPPDVITMIENLALSLGNQASSQNMTDDAMHIPVRDDVTFTDPLIATFKEIAAQGDASPRPMAMENYWVPFNENIVEILEKTDIPAKGIDQACKSMNESNGFPRLSGHVGFDQVKLDYGRGRTYSHDGGTYEFYVLHDWTGKITPVLAGFSFSPNFISISTPVTDDIGDLNFTPSNKPGSFNKTTPKNNAVNQPAKLTLKWGTSTNSTSYQYCLKKGIGSGTTCSTTWKSTGTNKYVNVSGLTSGTWYWQVRAKNANGFTYANSGTWWKFTVPQKPGAFNKLKPVNGATQQPTTVTFTWGASTSAAKYEFCYDTSNNNTCNSTWKSTNLAKTITLSGLLKGKTYYWMVRAVNSMGTTYSNANTWWKFTTKP